MTDTERKKTTPAETAKSTDSPEAPYYCPGCGRRWNYPTECRGQSPATPHPPIEVVSTDELSGDPGNHTPAPATGG